MTTAETPEAAAAAFLSDHGDVFTSELDLRPTFRASVKDGVKTAFGFSQRVQGIPVEGSIARVVVHDTGRAGNRRWATVFVGGSMANPALPLPERLVAGPQALDAAQRHERGKGLARWHEPQEILLWERTDSPAATTRAWKVVGGGASPVAESLSFYVDARTGGVIRVSENALRFAPASADTTITGIVTGFATPGLLPDTYPEGCEENDPEVENLEHVLVQVIHNGEVYSQAYTDADGEYTLGVPNGFSGEVRALLVGPEWSVSDWDGEPLTNPPPLPPKNLEHTCVGALPKIIEEDDPGSVVDFEFNSVSSPECTSREFCTAAVNAFRLVGQARDYLYEHIEFDSSMPCLTVFVNIGDEAAQCVAFYQPGGIALGTVPESGGCANTAYSTVVTHEVGHHVVWTVLEYQVIGAFHEVMGDIWSMFIHASPIIGQDATGCPSLHRDLSSATEAFPSCHNGSHVRGLVLGRIWWDIWCNLGTECGEALEAARDLHAAWMVIATGDQSAPASSSCPTTLQSAGPLTLIEVLIADDDDENLNNGTPHEAEICAAFTARSISPPPGYSVCGESAPMACRADCDDSTGRGILDVFDYLCFLNRFQQSDPWACEFDVFTGPGVCDVFDYVAFHAAFAEGCP